MWQRSLRNIALVAGILMAGCTRHQDTETPGQEPPQNADTAAHERQRAADAERTQREMQQRAAVARLIVVESVKPPEDTAGANGAITSFGLTREDLERLLEAIPSAARVVPLRRITAKAKFGGRSADLRVVGTTPDYFELISLRISVGKAFTDRDLQQKGHICVLTEKAARDLFASEDPIGKAIRLQDSFWTVVGIVQGDPEHAKATERLQLHADVYVPVTALLARSGDLTVRSSGARIDGQQVELDRIIVEADSFDKIDEPAAAVKAVLARSHPRADYRVTTTPLPEELQRRDRLRRWLGL